MTTNSKIEKNKQIKRRECSDANTPTSLIIHLLLITNEYTTILAYIGLDLLSYAQLWV